MLGMESLDADKFQRSLAPVAFLTGFARHYHSYNTSAGGEGYLDVVHGPMHRCSYEERCSNSPSLFFYVFHTQTHNLTIATSQQIPPRNLRFTMIGRDYDAQIVVSLVWNTTFKSSVCTIAFCHTLPSVYLVDVF